MEAIEAISYKALASSNGIRHVFFTVIFWVNSKERVHFPAGDGEQGEGWSLFVFQLMENKEKAGLYLFFS